jgi:hypothetical protein
MRTAGGGRVPPYNSPVAVRVRLVRIAAALILIGVVGTQVGPWGDDVRQAVTERIDELRR